MKKYELETCNFSDKKYENVTTEIQCNNIPIAQIIEDHGVDDLRIILFDTEEKFGDNISFSEFVSILLKMKDSYQK